MSLVLDQKKRFESSWGVKAREKKTPLINWYNDSFKKISIILIRFLRKFFLEKNI